MKERGQDSKFKGLRKAAGTAVLAVSLAACGSNNGTETQKPTINPSEKPTPTMTINPTETPMVTPTPEVTIAPTPEVTPKPESPITPDSVLTQVEAFQNGDKHALDAYTEPISLADLNAGFETFKASPSINTVTNASFDNLFKNCQNPGLPDKNLNEAVKQTSCADLAYYVLKAADLSGGDPAAVAFSTEMLRYNITVNLKGDLTPLIQILQAKP